MTNRTIQHVVHLENGERLEPDICKFREGGWLYCCWTGESGVQRNYPQHAVESHEAVPVAEDGEEAEA